MIFWNSMRVFSGYKKRILIFLMLFTCISVFSAFPAMAEINTPPLTKLDSHSMRPNNVVMGIHIGETVTEIAADTFRNQINLQYIEVSNDNPYFTSFSYCLYDKDMTTLICFPQAMMKAEIPSSVTRINQYALYGVDVYVKEKVKEAIRKNAEAKGVEMEYINPTVFPYDYQWPYTCEYPLTN